MCAGLNEAQCKATDAECQAYLSGSRYTSCYVSDAYDLAVQANACPNTDFTARAAVLNMTMSQVYQKTGIAPENNLITSAACDTSVNLFVSWLRWRYRFLQLDFHRAKGTAFSEGRTLRLELPYSPYVPSDLRLLRQMQVVVRSPPRAAANRSRQIDGCSQQTTHSSTDRHRLSR